MRLEYFIFPLLDVDVVISLRPVARRGVEREVISDSVSTIGPGKIHLHFSRKHPTSIVICGLCGIRNRGSSGAIHRLERVPDELAPGIALSFLPQGTGEG